MSVKKSATLSDEPLALLLDEVAAMAASGRSITNGLTNLENRSLGSLGAAATQIRQRLAEGESSETAIADVSKRYRSPIRIAIELLQQTRSPEAIVSLSRVLRSTARERQSDRTLFLGTVLHLLISVTVVFAVVPWLIATLSDSSWELGLSSSVVDVCSMLADSPPMTLAMIIGVNAVMLVTWFLLRPMFVYRTSDRLHASFCRWLALHLEVATESDGPEFSRLVQSAAEAAGDPESWRPVIQSITQGSISAKSLSFPDSIPRPMCEIITRLANGTTSCEVARQDLAELASLYEFRASRRRYFWTRTLPRSVTCLAMLTLMMLLLWLVIRPLGLEYEAVLRR